MNEIDEIEVKYFSPKERATINRYIKAGLPFPKRLRERARRCAEEMERSADELDEQALIAEHSE